MTLQSTLGEQPATLMAPELSVLQGSSVVTPGEARAVPHALPGVAAVEGELLPDSSESRKSALPVRESWINSDAQDKNDVQTDAAREARRYMIHKCRMQGSLLWS